MRFSRFFPLAILVTATTMAAPEVRSAIFHDAGWHTCIGDGLPAEPGGARRRRRGLGKTDYTFEWGASMYDSDMRVYVGAGNPVVEATIATMKRWAAEGK